LQGSTESSDGSAGKAKAGRTTRAQVRRVAR
jgi:hypothetical protein